MTTVWTGQREAALCQYEVMSDATDPEPLRQLVGGVIATLGDYYTHDKLTGACRRLGLPEPPGVEGTPNASASSEVSLSLRTLPCRVWPNGSWPGRAARA